MYRSILITFLLAIASIGAAAQTGGTVTGTVRLSDSRSPIHGATVQLTETKLSTVTDDNGAFRLENVPVGTHTILVHQEGFRDASRKVNVGAGTSISADFELVITGLNESVTVTASGTAQSTFEALASVTTVNASQLTERAAVGLGDVLNTEPGVNKRSSGPGTSRPVIRGFDGDRVLVAADGVSVGSLGSQSGDHSEPVDILALERVEVVRGPATLLYGSNAIGGVVNAISGRDEGAHPGVRGYFSAIGGTNNKQGAASGGIEYGTGNWLFWGNGSGQRTSDYTAGGDFGKVFNTFTRNASGGGGMGYYTDRAFFNANYNYYKSRYGIPLDFNEAEPELRTIRLHRHNFKTNFGYNEPLGFISNMKFTVDFSRYQHQEIADGEVGTTFRNNVGSYRGMFEQQPFKKLTGRFGFSGFHRDYSTVGDETLIKGPVKQNSFAVFGLEELKFERVTLQFGGRVENNRFRPSDPDLRDRDFTGVSGSAGARFSLWEGGAFVANYTHGYRAPALEELYNLGPHDGTLAFEIGDPNLRAEVSDGIDLSLRQQNSRVRAEFNVFYYNFKDFVFLAPTGEDDEESGFPIARYLQNDSRFRGAEFSLDLTAHKYLNILTGIDYVNAELADGRPLPRIPPLRARLGLDIHRGNFSFRPEFVAVGRQDRVFDNETPTPGYGIVNMTASYIIPRQHYAHLFSVSAYNLNNKLYYNHISFIKDISPEIGRGVRFTYTVRFF